MAGVGGGLEGWGQVAWGFLKGEGFVRVGEGGMMGILDMMDEEWSKAIPAMFSMLWVYGKDFEAGFWWLIFLIIWRRCSLQQKLLEKQIVLLGCFYSNSFFV